MPEPPGLRVSVEVSLTVLYEILVKRSWGWENFYPNHPQLTEREMLIAQKTLRFMPSYLTFEVKRLVKVAKAAA